MQLDGIDRANLPPFVPGTNARRVAVHSMADANAWQSACRGIDLSGVKSLPVAIIHGYSPTDFFLVRKVDMSARDSIFNAVNHISSPGNR